MDTEVQEAVDVEAGMPEVEATVPEQVETASPASEVETPAEENGEPSKTFTQEELDAIIGKRLAMEHRRWEREQARRASESQAPAPVELSIEQFATPEEYAEALAQQRAQELLNQREQHQRAVELDEAYHEREEKARDKYDDFASVVYNPQLRITDVMAETIKASDIGPEIAYHLGSNPKEATRIAALSPFLQAKEIGRLEAKLATNPPVKQTSKAPAPISPVSARSNGAPVYDTTDPRSTKSMSTSEWIEAERQRQIRKAQAQRS